MMTEGDLIAAGLSRQIEQDFPSQTGAEKARVFAVFRAVSLQSNLGPDDPI